MLNIIAGIGFLERKYLIYIQLNIPRDYSTDLERRKKELRNHRIGKNQ
jgi:hypothetical protein